MMATDTAATLSSNPVNTKKVQGRRSVRYESFDDLIQDAENLAGTPHRTLGNWSLGQILMHLSASCDGMIDGLNFKLPAPMRFVMTLVAKNKMLNDSIPPGFKAPNSGRLQPGPTSVEEGLAALRKAVERAKKDRTRCLHPAFGNLTADEWDQFQLRHCEMHMSFVVPK